MSHLAVPPRFHRTDPPTSGEAALEHRLSGKLVKDQKFALALVRDHPGHTAPELAGLIGGGEAARQRIGRRLSELAEHGKIHQRGTRDRCSLWWPGRAEEEKGQIDLFAPKEGRTWD